MGECDGNAQDCAISAQVQHTCGICIPRKFWANEWRIGFRAMFGTGSILPALFLLAMVPAMSGVSDVKGGTGSARPDSAHKASWAGRPRDRDSSLRNAQVNMMETKVISRFKRVYERERQWLEAKSPFPFPRCPEDKKIRHVLLFLLAFECRTLAKCHAWHHDHQLSFWNTNAISQNISAFMVMIQVLIRELLKASEWNVEVAVNSILRSDEDDGEKQQELQVLR